MSAESTKQHFAEICECIWDKIQGQEKLDKKTAASMRQFVANFTMVAWNIHVTGRHFSPNCQQSPSASLKSPFVQKTSQLCVTR